MLTTSAFVVSETVAIDGDDPQHLDWIYHRSLERAEEFRITGLTYRLTQGLYFAEVHHFCRNVAVELDNNSLSEFKLSGFRV